MCVGSTHLWYAAVSHPLDDLEGVVCGDVTPATEMKSKGPVGGHE